MYSFDKKGLGNMNVFCSPNQTPLAAIVDAVESFSQPKLRRHELWAVTCYFRPKAMRALVTELMARVRLTEIYIAYNYAEDFRYPDLAEELETMKEDFAAQNVYLDFRRIKSISGLFHSKGYAVIQRDGKADKIRDNFLLVTSGNLTEQGLGLDGASTNFELSYRSNTKKDVQAFIDIVDDIWDDEKLQAESVSKQSISNMEIQLDILLEATYLCKWEGSIRQELSAIFKVADESVGKVAMTNPLLIEMKFDIEKRSLGRYYFDERPPKPLPKYFLKNYTANTLIGHWCPSSVWDVVKQVHKDKFKEFKEWLKDATSESALKAVDEKCRGDLAKLKEGGIKIDGDPMESLRKRISNLNGNDIKAWRLYCQYESFSLRYDLEDTDGIDELFGSLKETTESKGRKNLVIRKLIEVIKTRDRNTMKLTEAESICLMSDLSKAEGSDDSEDESWVDQ